MVLLIKCKKIFKVHFITYIPSYPPHQVYNIIHFDKNQKQTQQTRKFFILIFLPYNTYIRVTSKIIVFSMILPRWTNIYVLYVSIKILRERSPKICKRRDFSTHHFSFVCRNTKKGEWSSVFYLFYLRCRI